MRVYIAGPWATRGDMPDIASQVESAGHVVTHKWWETEDTPEGVGADGILRQQALNDVNGVKQAHLVLLINSAKSEGKSLECGVAIRDNKPILAVGKRGDHSKNVFHYLDNFHWVPTVEDAVKVLNTLTWLTGHAKI